MPAEYDLPRTSKAWSEADVNRFNKLPYYLALQSFQRFPKWEVFSKLFGTRPWTPNQGTTLKAVSVQNSPVGRQQFFPNAITVQPNRDVFETGETTEDAIVYRHNYESPFINFNGPFADFISQQIPHAMEDVTMQVATSNDQFIRTFAMHYTPNVLIAGKATSDDGNGLDGGDFFTTAPTGIGNAAGTAAKSTAWLQAALGYVEKNLTYKMVKRAVAIMTEDLQATPFSGLQKGGPAANEAIKGKFCLIGSNEALTFLEFDEHVQSYQTNNVRIEDSEFSGKIGSQIIYKSERFPLRIAADGTFPAPEIEEAGADSFNLNEVVPNPAYRDAPYEAALLLGGDYMQAIQVGPSPKDFQKNGGKMSAEKFHGLSWNGEARITDQILLKDGNGDFHMNKYGEYVQIIADTVHGCIPVKRRHGMMIIYRRARVAD